MGLKVAQAQRPHPSFVRLLLRYLTRPSTTHCTRTSPLSVPLPEGSLEEEVAELMLRCSELEIALKASYARELECRTAVFFKQIPANRSNTLAAYEAPLPNIAGITSPHGASPSSPSKVRVRDPPCQLVSRRAHSSAASHVPRNFITYVPQTTAVHRLKPHSTRTTDPCRSRGGSRP